MNALAAVLLFLGLSLASLYVMPSGQPQPADFLLLGFAGIMMLMALGDEQLEVSAFMLSWALLILWVTLVSLSWALLLEATGFFLPMSYFLFNFLIGMALLRFLTIYGETAKHLIRVGVVIALLVSASQVLIQLSQDTIRATGSFNNPNQMAYFSLCALVILLMLDDFRPRMRPLVLAGMAAGVINILAASSLGAMGGGVLVMVGWAMANIKQVRHFSRLLLLLPVLVLAVAMVNNNSEGQIQRNVEARMDRAPDKVDGMYEQRRFDRLARFPEYALLGAGEGERRRFYPYHASEIHSSFVNMLFAYGVPGLVLFFLIIFSALRHAPLYVWPSVAGPLVYSISHNGLRTTLFWLMLALCWHLYRQGRKASRPFLPVDYSAHHPRQGAPGPDH